jgi:hypothetical protein
MTTVFRLHTTLIKLMVLTLGAHLQLLAAHLAHGLLHGLYSRGANLVA